LSSWLFYGRKQKSEALHQLTDDQLVNRYARNGDTEILGILFERYTHLLFPVCLKYLGNEAEAEDMVMLVFERMVEELRKTEVKSFKSWIYTVTKNQCLMQLRHRKTVERSRQEILQELQSEVMESGEDLHLSPDNHTPGMLPDAINRLNEAQKKCIQLFYLEEQSYQEVSRITGYSMNEVKSYIQNGKRNLKIILEKAQFSEKNKNP
jgi:RNA polymerase sigma-70 factor (ECF subfamily)